LVRHAPQRPLARLHGPLCQTISLRMIGRSLTVVNQGVKEQVCKWTLPLPSIVSANLCTRAIPAKDVMQEGKRGMICFLGRDGNENCVLGKVFYAYHHVSVPRRGAGERTT
jgi:hypothetical protein